MLEQSGFVDVQIGTPVDTFSGAGGESKARLFEVTQAAELWRLPRDDGPMKRRLRVSPAAAALTAALAPVWAGAAAIVIETAIAEATPAGSAAAKERLCTSCHGRNGLPADQTVPIMPGLQSAYLRKQLSDYRNGDRASQIMSSIAERLSEREIARIAGRFRRHRVA